MNYLKKQSGFTIVELLIVIVVIVILATISIIAYNGIQERSRATAVTNDIKALDKAFHLLAISEGRSTWWIDTEFTGGGNPTIDDIVTYSDLKNYFQKLSQPTIDATSSICTTMRETQVMPVVRARQVVSIFTSIQYLSQSRRQSTMPLMTVTFHAARLCIRMAAAFDTP